MPEAPSTVNESNSAVLLISCPDAKGIDATVTKFISDHNGNIIHLDQHVDFQQNVFFMRIEWELDAFTIPPLEIRNEFKEVADAFKMSWDLRLSGHTQRIGIFVSKQSHCLYDIFARIHAGEWNAHVPVVISNHPDLEEVATTFGSTFHHVPITPDTKEEQEKRQLEILREAKVDFIVLARYMQILTDNLLDHYANRIINIHHSFLPAFPGAKPYQSAYARGVKIIGATSHYVTTELDAGPIIEQDTIRVSHKDTVPDLMRKGRDLEKIVLSRAIWHHLQNKILVYSNKTVIFE